MKKLFPLAAAAVLIAGCGPDRSREDAHDVTRTCSPASPLGHCADKTPPRSIGFNNHFPNVETKCDGYGHRIFVASHDSAKGQNVIVLPDPTCPGYVKGQEPTVVAAAG